MAGVEVIVASGIIAALVSALFNLIQARKIEELRGRLDRRRFVHRVQFEKESKIYDELWAALVSLEDSIDSVHFQRMLRLLSSGDSPGRPEASEQFFAVFQGLRRGFRKSRPFVSGAVYESVNDLLSLVGGLTGPPLSQMSENSIKRLPAELQPKIDRICEAIRERIGNTEVEDRAA